MKKVTSFSSSAGLKEVTGKGWRPAPCRWRKADPGAVSQGQRRSQKERQPRAWSLERKETGRLCRSPRVETRKLGSAKSPPPRRPRPPGPPASGPMGVTLWGGVACAQVPPRPARSVAFAVVRAARRRAGPALSPPSSPPPAAGDTGFCSPGPRAIVSLVHGEFPRGALGLPGQCLGGWRQAGTRPRGWAEGSGQHGACG